MHLLPDAPTAWSLRELVSLTCRTQWKTVKIVKTWKPYATDRLLVSSRKNNELAINKSITSSKLTYYSTLETPFQLVFQKLPGRVYVSCWKSNLGEFGLGIVSSCFINLWESSSHMPSALAKDNVCSNSKRVWTGKRLEATRVNKIPQHAQTCLARWKISSICFHLSWVNQKGQQQKPYFLWQTGWKRGKHLTNIRFFQDTIES